MTISYPSDWDECFLADEADVNPESLGVNTPPNFEFLYIDIASVTTGVIDWSSITTQVFSTSPSRARRVVRPLDVLLSTVRPGLKSHTFADWQERDGFVCSTGFAVIRARENLEPHYLYQLIFHDGVCRQLRRLETGSNYPAVNESDVKRLLIPVPPLPEQRAIAAILDTLDAAIQHTAALIAKLKQMKAGLLHDLLTRGLDDNGELRDPLAHTEQFKDSPLGLIPRDWEVVTFEKIADIIDPQPSHRAPAEVAGGEPYIGVGDFRPDGSIDFENCRKVSSEAVNQQQHRFRIEAGDIIFGKIGTIGVPQLLPQVGHRYALNANVVLIKPHAIGAYVFHFLHSHYVDEQIRQQIHSTSQPAFGIQRIRVMMAPKPSENEQVQIAERLKFLASWVYTEESTLAKLKLLKAGLMDDLLTGRVRIPADS